MHKVLLLKILDIAPFWIPSYPTFRFFPAYNRNASYPGSPLPEKAERYRFILNAQSGGVKYDAAWWWSLREAFSFLIWKNLAKFDNPEKLTKIRQKIVEVVSV